MPEETPAKFTGAGASMMTRPRVYFLKKRCFVVKKLGAIAAALCFCAFAACARASERYDVVVAGGGMSGMGAAIQASRLGARVLVVEPTGCLGGQAVAAGVSTMDDMSTYKSGIYLEFVRRLDAHYTAMGKSISTCYWDNRTTAFEPFVGRKILSEMAAECRPAPVIAYHSEVTGVAKDGDTVTGVTLKTPEGEKTVECGALIDATEYGDVLPLAGAAYRSGNEVSPNITGASMVQDITWTAVMRKYPDGVPARLRPEHPLPGWEQAKANYEKYVTADGFDFQNVYPVELPVNFVSHNGYRGLPDSFIPGFYDGAQANWAKISKTSVNWGNDYPGAYKWEGRFGMPAAYFEDKTLRARIERDALIKTLHFVYYVQNVLDEPWSVDEAEYGELPEAARDLPDEWKEVARHMPPAPYVRESRRAVGDFTLTAEMLHRNSLSWRDGNRSLEFCDAVAVGGYIIDLHHSATDADLESELGEKAASVKALEPRGPFQAPMRALIPERVDGLIAAEKNLSMSRLASGAMRLQPVCMMTGQAAGALAAISVKLGMPPRRVHPVLVQRVLLDAGVRLSTNDYSDVPDDHPFHSAVVLSTLYGLLDLRGYRDMPSYDIEFSDDPRLKEAAAEGRDKSRFGVDELLTRGEAATMAQKACEALGLPSPEPLPGDAGQPVSRHEFVGLVARSLGTDDAAAPDGAVVTRGDAAAAVTDAMGRAAAKKR